MKHLAGHQCKNFYSLGLIQPFSKGELDSNHTFAVSIQFHWKEKMDTRPFAVQSYKLDDKGMRDGGGWIWMHSGLNQLFLPVVQLKRIIHQCPVLLLLLTQTQGQRRRAQLSCHTIAPLQTNQTSIHSRRCSCANSECVNEWMDGRERANWIIEMSHVSIFALVASLVRLAKHRAERNLPVRRCAHRASWPNQYVPESYLHWPAMSHTLGRLWVARHIANGLRTLALTKRIFTRGIQTELNEILIGK